MTNNNDEFWVFTKQNTNFKDAINAVEIVNNYCLNAEGSFQNIFEENYFETFKKIGPHRMLTTAQLYGLLTKNNYYKKSNYQQEKPTTIYDKIKNNEILISEQLLKIKFPAITDNKASEKVSNINTEGIFAIPFAIKILTNLKKRGFDSINESTFFYIISHYFDIKHTMDAENEIIENINNIIDTTLITTFKNKSRVVSLFKNTNIFIFRNNTIELNMEFEFAINQILTIEHELYNLENFNNYKNFLENSQNFNINIITPKIPKAIIDETKDTEYLIYQEKLETEEIKITENNYINNSKNKPNIDNTNQSSKSQNYNRDPKIGVIARRIANYNCQINSSHITFKNIQNNNYVEIHHIIPISLQKHYWSSLSINIDCLENVIALCPNCHRSIHLGNSNTKKQILKNVYNLKKEKLKEIGIDISYEQLLKFYNINN